MYYLYIYHQLQNSCSKASTERQQHDTDNKERIDATTCQQSFAAQMLQLMSVPVRPYITNCSFGEEFAFRLVIELVLGATSVVPNR